MRQYITATSIEHTDLQGFSLLDTIEEKPIPGILASDTFRKMNKIVEHPNIYFRHPSLDRDAVRKMFTIDQESNGYNDAFLNDVCFFADSYEHQQKAIIVLSYKEQQDGRLGVAFVTVPTSEINAFQRNNIIDQLLESL